MRRWLAPFLGVLLVIAVLGSASAQASTGSHKGSPAKRTYHAGNYFGTIHQTSPRSYSGKIHFLVRNGKISHLTFTAATECGGVLPSVVREGRQLQSFAVRVRRDGSFLYRGTFKERHIRFRGQLSGHTARGSLFESFPTGTLVCSMGKPAPFTAAH